jgi:hypothetical protein
MGDPSAVMPALVAGIHVLAIFPQGKTWMAGSSPAMTMGEAWALNLLCHSEDYPDQRVSPAMTTV